MISICCVHVSLLLHIWVSTPEQPTWTLVPCTMGFAGRTVGNSHAAEVYGHTQQCLTVHPVLFETAILMLKSSELVIIALYVSAR